MVIVIVMTGIVTFWYVHWREHLMSDETGLNAAQACSVMLEAIEKLHGDIDPDSTVYADTREAMRELCRRYNMDYMYAYRCDVEAGKITYLFCVADKDADDEMVARERGFGTVVDAEFSDVDYVITDAGIEEKNKKKLQDAGMQVIVAE